MGDMTMAGPDSRCLFLAASGQQGHFTTADAAKCGYGTDVLTHGVRSGRFIRVYWGVYRLRDYPSSPLEHVMAAWLAVGAARAVVSHESAIDIHDISDVIPHATHLTVPRSHRNLPSLPGVRIHTTTRPFGPADIVVREGMRVTSVARTIVDCAETGTGPEQIEMAVREAVSRAMTTPRRLLDAAEPRSFRVRELIGHSLALAV